MGDTVTIMFRDKSVQPYILSNVKSIDVKRDCIVVTGLGYRQVFFKDVIHSINADYSVGVFIR